MIDERRMLLIKEVGDLVTQKEELRHTLIERDAEIAKLRKQLEQVEAHSEKLQLASDDMYQGYMDELNHMSGWPELRTEIEWFADNNFYA